MNPVLAVSIKKIDGSGGSDIEDFVLRSPGAILYSSPHYLTLISNHLNVSCGWFVASDGDDIKGALPFALKDGGFGPVWNSMPFYGSNGGVVQATPDLSIKKELIREFYDSAERANACSATIITNPLLNDHNDYESSIDGFLRDERIGQITHLPENPGDELVKMFKDPRPRNIRRAIKEGIEVANGNEEVRLSFFIKCMLKTCRKLEVRLNRGIF